MRIGLLALCVRSEDGLHKTERHLETILGHAVPEVKILAGLGVFEWDVADDAKRDEGDGVAVADLGDGAALHIDGHGLGEMVEYLAHLLLRIDKPVAADGQSRLDTRYLQRLIYQRLRSLKAGGHPEHLAVGRIVGESAALLFTAGAAEVIAKGVVKAYTSNGATLSVLLYLRAFEDGDFASAWGIGAVLLVLVLAINLAARLAKAKLKQKQ